MKSISLAAKYRPQNFASVVGQETITSILSKAAFEQKVAPAYLLSGTRGVGKTTIARIFAKALNCENANNRANGEPCNECQTCQRITQNAFVDVMEIDGASNRGVEEAKRIRDIVQYPPLEGRFKIIIIDEAHMLTREAFNALLKTLEEPPSYTSFILATTEAHKFPITIVSRCQHFVFKQVPSATLEKHLKYVLSSENWQYEQEAISLLVRRASGSVRDAMSLLGQSLVLAQNPLTSETTRAILGLAGKEILEQILSAIHENNSLKIAEAVENMMQQGIDIVYFMREISQIWRSLYLIKEYKEQSYELLSLSQDEISLYANYAQKFSTSFIHSAWQLTLESQRRISMSLEPAVALELFLINLALLPSLLPLNELQADIKAQKIKQQEQYEQEDKKDQKISSLTATTEVEEEKKKHDESFYTQIDATENAIAKPEKSNVLPVGKFEEKASNEEVLQDLQLPDSQNKHLPQEELEHAFSETVSNIDEIKENKTNEESKFILIADSEDSEAIPISITLEDETFCESQLAELDFIEVDETSSNQVVEVPASINYEAFLDFLSLSTHTAQNPHSALLKNLKISDGDIYFDEAKQSYVLSIRTPSAICAKDLRSTQMHAELVKKAENYIEQLAQAKLIVEVYTKAPPKNTAALLAELEQKAIVQELKKSFNAHIVHCESKKID